MADDPSLFCWYIAPGMRVDVRRAQSLAWEPAVVTASPGDTLGVWKVSGCKGDSSWTDMVRYDCMRPRSYRLTPATGCAPTTEIAAPVAQNALEIRELNADCDALEMRLAALEARQAVAVTSADPLMSLADIAANVAHDDLRADLEHHVSTARKAGVRFLVVPSMTIDGPRGAQQTLDLARGHRGTVLPCVGVHPFWASAIVGTQTRVDGADCVPATVDALRQVAANPEVRCIGECGLDFSKGPTEDGGYPAPEIQLRWFEQQVSLAVELEKPLYLHERDAHAEFLAILRPWHAAGTLPPCVIHAFTGSEEELVAYREMDFHIGVTGYLMRKKNPMVGWLPKHVPLSRLLIETDSPYMGFKGCRKTEPTENSQKHTYPNVPAALPGVLRAVAESYGITPVEVASATTRNAKRFFSI